MNITIAVTVDVVHARGKFRPRSVIAEAVREEIERKVDSIKTVKPKAGVYSVRVVDVGVIL